MKRALSWTWRLGAIGLLVTLCTITLPVATELAGADSGTSCTVTGEGSYSTNTFTNWSVACTGVNPGTSVVIVEFPVTRGDVELDIGSADSEYGAGPTYADLPSSFTLHSSDTPPADDSDPSAPYPTAQNFDSTGNFAPAPDGAVLEYNQSTETIDECGTDGTNCGTVDSSAWIDDDAGTTTTLDPSVQIANAASSEGGGIIQIAGGMTILAIVAMCTKYVFMFFRR